MTGVPINYPAALTRIARAAMDPRNPGDFVGAVDAITLREAASELARLALSEATLRERVANLERGGTYRTVPGLSEMADMVVRAMADQDELGKKMLKFDEQFWPAEFRATGRAGDPS